MAEAVLPKIMPNLPHQRIQSVVETMGPPPWSARLIDTDLMWAVLICYGPGHANNEHYHPDCDEWWAVLEGELEWSLDGAEYFTARKGDLVFAARRVWHHIRHRGEGISLRLAVGMPDNPHIYEGPTKPRR